MLSSGDSILCHVIALTGVLFQGFYATWPPLWCRVTTRVAFVVSALFATNCTMMVRIGLCSSLRMQTISLRDWRVWFTMAVSRFIFLCLLWRQSKKASSFTLPFPSHKNEILTLILFHVNVTLRHAFLTVHNSHLLLFHYCKGQMIYTKTRVRKLICTVLFYSEQQKALILKFRGKIYRSDCFISNLKFNIHW